MFTRTRFAVSFVFCGSLAMSAAQAQTQPTACFTAASLKGSYAVIGHYGANVAIALGRRYFDGNGNLTGTFLVNEPTAGSTTGARTIITGTQAGTYTVNCDGTGVITRLIKASNGVMTTQKDDLIITKASRGEGQFTATALIDAQEVPSAIVEGGIFLTRSYTRVPDQFGTGDLAGGTRYCRPSVDVSRHRECRASRERSPDPGLRTV